LGWVEINNKYSEDKVIEACSLFGMMNLKGTRFSSKDPIKAIQNMHDRGNGLGGGFAIYGVYPDYKEYYALHLMYMDTDAKSLTESLLKERFDIHIDEEIPTREADVQDPPILRRYFVEPQRSLLGNQHPDDYIRENVMRINIRTAKAFVFSSGKISLNTIALTSIWVTSGRAMEDFPRILPDGGVVHILSIS
jgi:glutamate synthase domain-containing protein 1